MKSLIIIVTCFISLSVVAQNGGTVNITVNGNRNKEVRIDGKSYFINTDASSTTSPNAPIQITSLAPGQHSLEVIRTNRNNITRTDNTTTFNLRPGYDLNITVNNNGTLQISETRIRGNTGYQNRNRNQVDNTGYGRTAAMTDASFSDLYNNINNQWGLGAKMSSLTKEFNNVNNYFTTAQARQLIQLVSDENNRLQLAKLAYDNVVDPENYSQLYNVLNNQSGRNELDAFIKNNSRSNTGYSSRIAMTDTRFNDLYDKISRQFGLGAKMSSLTNEFDNANNYFTTAQARQLIQLVSDENNRLQLAKSSYDNIVDPENFSRLYDLFTSQSRRTELAEYARSYSYNK